MTVKERKRQRMRIDLSYGSDVIALPARAVAYMDKADYLALRLLLLVCSDKGLRSSLDVASLAREFAVTKEQIEAALAFWINAGIIETDGADSESADAGAKRVSVSVKAAENGEKISVVSSDTMPSYTGKELEAIMNSDSSISLLIDECQRIAGKVFGAHEINKIISLSDYMRLDHDYILLLFEYCKRIGKPSVAYIFKTAVGLFNDGITTYPALEEYIAAAQKRRDTESIVRALAGLGARVLTAKERAFVAKWTELDVKEDVLSLAYEVTANNTGAFSFPYMNKVLINWHGAGYKSAREIEDALSSYKEKKESSDAKGSFDTDEFFEAALKRSYSMMKKTQSEIGKTGSDSSGK